MKKKFRFEPSDIIMILILLGVLAFFLFVPTGCATPPTIYYDANGNVTGGTASWGFLRTIKIHQKKADGSEITIETSSNTGEVLNGLNQIMGTGVGAARDLMP